MSDNKNNEMLEAIKYKIGKITSKPFYGKIILNFQNSIFHGIKSEVNETKDDILREFKKNG